jgi:hypothetical protein
LSFGNIRAASQLLQRRSGSGTSTSGGWGDNGDEGNDKMPESNMTVFPHDPNAGKT